MTETPPRYASLLADLDLNGFRAIAAALREGVVLLDQDLRIRDLNSAAERILGREYRVAEAADGVEACAIRFPPTACRRRDPRVERERREQTAAATAAMTDSVLQQKSLWLALGVGALMTGERALPTTAPPSPPPST